MHHLDEIDFKIIEHLEQNAKMSQKELAQRIGLTITPTFERVKKLEREGIIEGYTVRLNKQALGKGLRVLCHVSLRAHSNDVIEQFEEQVVHLKEVSSCYHIAGVFDYSLLVEVKDMEGYERFLKQKLSKIATIGNVQSSFVMSDLLKSKRG